MEVRMFNISDLITRAWNILWRYRVLWVFALLLALSGGAGGGGSLQPFRGKHGQGPPVFRDRFRGALDPV